MTICAWLAIPTPAVTFTMQTFAVLLALGTLGGSQGTMSSGVYRLGGRGGAPVFSGFRGGAAALLDATGGFLWGFLAAGLIYRLTEKLGKLPAMILAQFVCYLCGCLWFSVWAGGGSLWAAALVCVAPYLIPDGIKLVLALKLSKRLARHL